ncbi:hypothetical protein [Geobacter sp.]|uniref:hypothetical protein n=1 Tax=Geobacter sp. TaxID=46610 RepID=UPI0026020C9A|nr:hypothetical protein [Geobacter sp.]
MDHAEKVILRLLRLDQKIDIVLSNQTFDNIQHLASTKNQDPGVYLREIIKDHVGAEMYRITPQPRYEWMDR